MGNSKAFLRSEDKGASVEALGPVRVLCVGDSLTVGYMDGGRGAPHPYCATLEGILRGAGEAAFEEDGKRVGAHGEDEVEREKRGRGATTAVVAHSGWTAAEVASDPGIEKALRGAQERSEPFTHVAILAGTNDLHTLRPAEKILEPIRGMWKLAEKYGAVPLALTLPGMGAERHRPDFGNLRREINQLIFEAGIEAMENNESRLTVVDVDAAVPHVSADPENPVDGALVRALWQDDTLHMTAEGYDRVAGVVASAVFETGNAFAFATGNRKLRASSLSLARAALVRVTDVADQKQMKFAGVALMMGGKDAPSAGAADDGWGSD